MNFVPVVESGKLFLVPTEQEPLSGESVLDIMNIHKNILIDKYAPWARLAIDYLESLSSEIELDCTDTAFNNDFNYLSYSQDKSSNCLMLADMGPHYRVYNVPREYATDWKVIKETISETKGISIRYDSPIFPIVTYMARHLDFRTVLRTSEVVFFKRKSKTTTIHIVKSEYEDHYTESEIWVGDKSQKNIWFMKGDKIEYTPNNRPIILDSIQYPRKSIDKDIKFSIIHSDNRWYLREDPEGLIKDKKSLNDSIVEYKQKGMTEIEVDCESCFGDALALFEPCYLRSATSDIQDTKHVYVHKI